jgi:glycogen synthase kinase 3 beta
MIPHARYQSVRPLGQGTFGTVMLMTALDQGNEPVAIKKVLQDPRFKNRELSIMKSLNHRNIVGLRNHFYTNGEQRQEEVYLNLVLEYVPETLYRCCRDYAKSKQFLPNLYVKVYLHQLLRCVGFLHLSSVNVCHRDIKPQNLLVDAATGVLKICDFGSAKQLDPREANVAYICSRYYRAPELILGETNYTTAIDLWSVGCIFAEMLLGQPIFAGDSALDQLVEIIKVLGTPTTEQVQRMTTRPMAMKLPQLKPKGWDRVFKSHVTPDAIDLLTKLLNYIPKERILPWEAFGHEFFDELRNPSTVLPNGNPLPKLFDFLPEELEVIPAAVAAKLGVAKK